MIEFRSPTEIFARSEELVVRSDREAEGSNCDESRSKYYKDDISDWHSWRSRVIRHFSLLASPREQSLLDTASHVMYDLAHFCLDVTGGGQTVGRLCDDCPHGRPCLSVCANSRSARQSLSLSLWLTAPATQCQHGRSPSECHSGQTGTPLPAATHRRRLLSPCWRLSVCRDWSLGLSRLLSLTSKYDQDLQTWAEGWE